MKTHINLFPHEASALTAGRLGVLVRIIEPQPFRQNAEWIMKTKGKDARYHTNVIITETTNRETGHISSYISETPFNEWMQQFAPFSPGDVVGCKEEWACDIAYDSYDTVTRHVGEVAYRDGGYSFSPGEQGKWRSADTMPDWAVRHHVTVQSVTAKRAWDVKLGEWVQAGSLSSIYEAKPITRSEELLRERFNSLHGPGSWERNPWLWLYTINPTE